MLIIRQEQIESFRQSAWIDFADEMLAHSKAFSPKLCAVLGDDQLKIALRHTLDKAATYGFTYRGPIRLLVEMMFLYGSAFDADPQYPWAGEILRTPGDQMQRAEQMFQCIIQYQESVSGPDGTNTRKALVELSALTERPVSIAPAEFETGMRAEMASVFPQKSAYIGDDGILRLVKGAVEEARVYQLPSIRGERLLSALKFAFGHGCTHDALYPWIARTLQDDKITNPTARVDRLERKAITWLEHVIASFPEGHRP